MNFFCLTALSPANLSLGILFKLRLGHEVINNKTVFTNKSKNSLFVWHTSQFGKFLYSHRPDRGFRNLETMSTNTKYEADPNSKDVTGLLIKEPPTREHDGLEQWILFPSDHLMFDRKSLRSEAERRLHWPISNTHGGNVRERERNETVVFMGGRCFHTHPNVHRFEAAWGLWRTRHLVFWASLSLTVSSHPHLWRWEDGLACQKCVFACTAVLAGGEGVYAR